jgi:hypothetical protein
LVVAEGKLILAVAEERGKVEVADCDTGPLLKLNDGTELFLPLIKE